MPSFLRSLRVRSCQLKGRPPAELPGTKWPWKFRKPAESRLTAFGISPEGRHNNMIRKATLKIGIPALLLCMALNAYLAVDHLRQMRKMDALTLESSQMQATISVVLMDLTDMETSQAWISANGQRIVLAAVHQREGQNRNRFRQSSGAASCSVAGRTVNGVGTAVLG